MMRTVPLAATVALLAGCATSAPVLHHKLVPFPQEAMEKPILSGPPETGGMRSGYVTLKAGEDMHRHTTGTNEELLVFLSGKGEVIVGAEHVVVGAGEALYIPPRTEHEVHASVTDELRYVYTVAPAR
jgi:mannose-6-phosphate isomerase-like protein (cupin superfamily)